MPGDNAMTGDFEAKYPPNVSCPRNVQQVVYVVDAPEISLAGDEKAGDVLLKFYRALGWNGEDYLDPCKVRTTKAVFDRLYDMIFAKAPDPVGVGMQMCNRGPGTDEHIPPGKVCLLEGWVKPAESKKEGDEPDGFQQTV